MPISKNYIRAEVTDRQKGDIKMHCVKNKISEKNLILNAVLSIVKGKKPSAIIERVGEVERGELNKQ